MCLINVGRKTKVQFGENGDTGLGAWYTQEYPIWGGLLWSKANTVRLLVPPCSGVAEKFGTTNKMDPSKYSQPKNSKKP